jgi:hypothetical protein
VRSRRRGVAAGALSDRREDIPRSDRERAEGFLGVVVGAIATLRESVIES